MEYNKISHKVTNKISLTHMVFCLIKNGVYIDDPLFCFLQVFRKENMFFLRIKDMKVRILSTVKSVRRSLWFSINNFVPIPIPWPFLVFGYIVAESVVRTCTMGGIR